jgi:hypothetical protein
LKRAKALTKLFAAFILASCSDPQGWTLWIHEYTIEADALNPSTDEWRSLETYVSSAECKKQVESQLALIEKTIQEQKTGGSFDDYRLTIEREKQGLRVAAVPTKTSNDAKTNIFTNKIFCLPLGIDPRPKDPVTWTLWRHETTWNKNGVVYESWQPEESYLVDWKCTQAKSSNQKIYNPYNEKSEKVTKGQRYTKTYFQCAPSTISPWGKEG